MREYSWLDRARQLGLNTAVGAGRSIADAGLFGMRATARGMNKVGLPSQFIVNQANRSEQAWESQLGHRVNTRAGMVGRAAAPLLIPPVARVAGAGAGMLGRALLPTAKKATTKRAPRVDHSVQPPRRWRLEFTRNGRHTKFKNMSNEGVQDWTRALDQKGLPYKQDVM